MSAAPSSVERVLREAIATAHAKGWVLRPWCLRFVRDDERFCCAIGAVLVAGDPSEEAVDAEADFERVAERLGIELREADAISVGFDRGVDGPDPWHAVGSRLWRWVVEQGFAPGGAS